MKGTIRIISGSMKGRVIPFNTGRFNNADITPQKVKGAIFSIIGEDLQGKTFVDLFSGSGQIGIEALSRGCSFAVLNERDKFRFEFIKDFLVKNKLLDRVMLLDLNVKSAIKYIANKGVRADFIFIDPPYRKEDGVVNIYSDIISHITSSDILHEDSLIIVQHFSANELPQICSRLVKGSVKRYGSTSLSIYVND
ncbi:MAG: RsmD family RNA methyltransferase [Leptospirales bacterium]|nr:RsmD family RNA methyltransferase [Leptospirales bacterium]